MARNLRRITVYSGTLALLVVGAFLASRIPRGPSHLEESHLADPEFAHIQSAVRLSSTVHTAHVNNTVSAAVTQPQQAPPAAPGEHPHIPSRLFQHFDFDNDGKLSEKEVAALLKQLTRKKKEDGSSRSSSSERQPGTHDISIDGETLSVGDGEFDLLFKQLSNLKQTKDPSKDPRKTLQEDIVFVKDLVIVFCAATIGGVLATHFRQPPLIGFLLGGMVIGPGGIGVVTELVEVETLASLGIAFLLFSLGIEFSLSELQGVRRVVLVGGIMSMFGAVFATGLLSMILGLVKTIPEAVALGLAVSLSSTAVVLQCLPSAAPAHAQQQISVSDSTGSIPPRSPTTMHHRAARPMSALSSNGSNGTGNSASFSSSSAQNPPSTDVITAFDVSKDLVASQENPMSKMQATSFDSPRSRKVMLGLLVFQDVMIGLILALLPTLQGSLSQFFEEFLSSMLRLGCFVMLSLITAEFLLPILTERLDQARSQEVFTIGCVVFCLAMAYLSERMGLAIELGAFTAGIMLSESRHKTRVEDSISSVRSMFSAVFFISVGMMIHWRYFYQNFVKMAILLLTIILVKSVVMGTVVLTLGGLPLRTALACGAAISQAGEFTFVVASKGQALLLFSASEARMINGATALSMLITPYIIRHSRRWTSKGSSAPDIAGV